MNREIKFRAWHKKYKEYWEVMSILFDTQELELYEWGNVRFDEVIFEQYTGLKDKNGVEIYEYSELDGTYEVVFKDLKYILRHISNNDIIDLYDYWRGKNGEVEVTRKYTKV